VAVTPGCERIPAPTSDTFPTSASCSSSAKPISGCTAMSAATARGPSVRGSVNVMSVRCADVRLTFCRTMSMLISASATVRKIRAAMPGVSGTSVTVILASDRSWATPVMIAFSMGISSIEPLTSEPGLSLYELRTRSGTL
jgi:hypothetical protein